MDNAGLNILYITTRLPWPLIGGDRVHIYHYLKELKKLGHKITLVTLVSDDDDIKGALEHNEFYTKLIPIKFNKKLAYLNAAKAIFNDRPFIVEYFYSKQMQKIVDEEIATGLYDITIGYIIRSLPYLEKHKNIKKIIHLCDAVSMMYERRLKTKNSIFDRLKIGIEYIKVKNYEKKACRITDKQVLISETDKKYLSKFANTTNCVVIGLATDTDYYYPQNTKLKNAICFVGSLQYIPNSEAAIYFATKVFPLIKKEIPDVKFKIIGANPRKELFEATKYIDGIEITGRVDDVREHMKDCKVSVCPVKIAGGIQNKILEAMAMGIPVVTTPEGAEGIRTCEDILHVANSEEDYAQKVVSLMLNSDLQKEIGYKSKNFIQNHFSWEKVGNDWDKLIRGVLN